MSGLLSWVKSLSATLPLSLSSTDLDINIALDSSGFAPAATTQKSIKASAPLALSDAGALSIDLGAYQKKVSADLPLSITNDKLSLDISKFATTDDLGKKQKTITTSSPLGGSATPGR